MKPVKSERRKKEISQWYKDEVIANERLCEAFEKEFGRDEVHRSDLSLSLLVLAGAEYGRKLRMDYEAEKQAAISRCKELIQGMKAGRI